MMIREVEEIIGREISVSEWNRLVASMKVIAISQRGTKRDFVDLFFTLQDVPFHKVAEHMVKRFGAEHNLEKSPFVMHVYFFKWGDCEYFNGDIFLERRKGQLLSLL